MKTTPLTLLIILSAVLLQCSQEDYGPKQPDMRSYPWTGFDRIEASEGLDITVEQGPAFSIAAEGDRRDLNDLEVKKLGTTLTIRYARSRTRQYTTAITITMPQILGADLSGGVNARVTGFNGDTERFDIALSDGTTGQFQVHAGALHALVTGASEADFTGSGESLDASVSGTSVLSAGGYPVVYGELAVAGGSKVQVNVSTTLTVSASGGSEVLYFGNPAIERDVSEESSVRQH